MNAKNWRACVKDGVAKAKPVYATQIALYEAYMEGTVPGISDAPALFTAINKDTAELHHELVPFDAALAQSMSDRAVRILQATDAGELLPRVATTPDFFECRFCPWAERCWGAGPVSEDGILHFNPWMDFNDEPPSESPFGCDPDPEQVATFLDVVFSWCEGLIPLRGFVDKGQGRGGRPHNIWIPADDTAREKLATFASWANREGAAVYVIPGTVAEQGLARAADVLQMQAIVVDLDAGDIPAKLDHVTRHLGTPTLIVESGGRTAEARPSCMSGGS